MYCVVFFSYCISRLDLKGVCTQDFISISSLGDDSSRIHMKVVFRVYGVRRRE